ncbi:TIGR02281 family clan AA aspartic protease [Rhodovulum sp. 12E13]|uniref:retropepsin-like aspartic protease family protein n=1 Tax=Rhodovulum sp. 12E13 TaxID=2203891 RepID=UPI0026B184CF
MPEMTGEQTASLLYLVLLGSVLAGYFFLSHRQSLGQGLRQAGLWALIFIGVIAGYGLWSDLQGTVTPQQSVFTDEGRVVVPRSADGHYRMVLEVNGTPVRFVVDTGATDIVLSADDARRVGLDPSELAFVGAARTANGMVSTARVWLDEVRLGGIADTGVPAVVNGGEMTGSLLGMTYLDRFSEVRIGGGALTLVR